jgi:hypothetical protein
MVGAQGSPHWKKNTCQTCHVEPAPVDGLVNLNESDAEALCETCHGDRGDAIPCRHASGIPIGDVAIPESLGASLKDDKVVCSTCHDIVYQCEHARPHFSYQNRGFLRDRTSRDSSDYCFKCHDSSEYGKLNPHAGVTGMPPRSTCFLCHASIPEASVTGELLVKFNMQHDMNDTCRGCHNVRPHPKGMTYGGKSVREEWIHLITPSAAVIENMRESQIETGIGLPLNPLNGEVFCATCHNPHDFKLGGEHGSEEQVAKNRLRMNNICQACHDK